MDLWDIRARTGITSAEGEGRESEEVDETHSTRDVRYGWQPIGVMASRGMMHDGRRAQKPPPPPRPMTLVRRPADLQRERPVVDAEGRANNVDGTGFEVGDARERDGRATYPSVGGGM